MKRHSLFRALTVAAAVAALAVPAGAQRAGQNAKITIGRVVKMERVQLQSDAAKGAVVGGVIGYHTTKSSRSSSRKWRNAAIGAAAGSAARRAQEGDLTGIKYTVEMAGGSMMQVISEQTEIRQGDCVAVEEVGNNANVRRVSSAMCEPSAQEVVASPAIQAELQEEAIECLAAKDELVNAETDAEIERAIRKIQILCDA